MKRRLGILVLAVLLLSMVIVPCSSASATAIEKTKLTIMIVSGDDPIGQLELEALQAHFADKYEIESKPWALQDAKQIIMTTAAAGDALDLVMYLPQSMKSFVDAGLALDLTPYLDENNGEWRNSFSEGALGVGTYDGKVYNVPYAAVFPMLLVNRDITDSLGIEFPQTGLLWDDFIEACKKIKDNSEVWPFVTSKDWAPWVTRNNLLNVWDDPVKSAEFAAGQISFNDPMVTKAFDGDEELFNNYTYPGAGATSLTLEQATIAFNEGKAAIRASINTMVAGDIKNSGLNNLQIVAWPRMGTGGCNLNLGGANGYFIPSNAKNIEASIELIKYLTSPELLQIRVDNGSPVAVTGVVSDDPNFPLYSLDAGNICAGEIGSISPELDTIIGLKCPAYFMDDRESAVAELEELRLEAIGG